MRNGQIQIYMWNLLVENVGTVQCVDPTPDRNQVEWPESDPDNCELCVFKNKYFKKAQVILCASRLVQTKIQIAVGSVNDYADRRFLWSSLKAARCFESSDRVSQ